MNRPEEALHRAAVKFIHAACPEVYFFHVPNQQGTRKGWEQGILTALGLKRGVADLVLLLPGGRTGFIEFKTLKGQLSLDQKVFRDHAIDRGALWALCRSLEEVEATLRAWGLPCRGRVV